MYRETISVIVPCYNEEEVLPIFIQELLNVFEEKLVDVSAEILFIDDGSSDETLSLLMAFSERYSFVKYISFSRNFGKEGAMLAGLEKASGEYTVIMDADLQHPPKLIVEMYREIKTGRYDMIGTFRMTRDGESAVRSFLSRNFYKAMNKVSEIDMIENSMDFRMLTRNAVNAILELPEYNRFSKGIFSWIGFETKYLSFDNVERAAGKTKWHFRSLVKYSLEGCFSFSTFPLTISSYLGILLCIASIIIILCMIVQSLLYGVEGSGFATILCSIFMIGGIQLFCIGILGQYLAKTYLECKNRPKYIIKKTNVNMDKAEENK